MSSVTFEIEGLNLFGQKKTPVDLQKSFPVHHACPKCLAVEKCLAVCLHGSAFTKNGAAFHQDFEKVVKTLVDW